MKRLFTSKHSRFPNGLVKIDILHSRTFAQATAQADMMVGYRLHRALAPFRSVMRLARA